MATIIDPPNSVWPNGLKVDSEGYVTFYPMGTNKVDITTITWPDGDKLVSPFVYKDDKLVGFVDTKALTVSGNASTTMNYSHIEADFSSISEGTLTVDAPNASVKEFKWAIVQNDDGSFDYIIIDFNNTDQATLDAVRAAYKVVDKKMYAADGSMIGTWDTSKIEVGGIADGDNGIYDGLYSKWDANDDEREIILTEFASDLSSLTDGSDMFAGCSSLTSFTSDLSSLTDGSYMFDGCKLDSASVKNIIDTINKNGNGYTLLLGIGCANTEEDKKAFAAECGYSSMSQLLCQFEYINWYVEAQYNGRPTTTYSLRQPAIEEGELLPVFVKLEEVKEYADYTSIDETKKYKLRWFHETAGSTNGYTQYATLEEAIEALNIKPIERN